jgi:hypothetical protein
MAYVSPNYKTKKALKEALAAGKAIQVYQPGPFSHTLPENGTVYLEGPHYPEPHKWYAQGTMKNGRLISVR